MALNKDNKGSTAAKADYENPDDDGFPQGGADGEVLDAEVTLTPTQRAAAQAAQYAAEQAAAEKEKPAAQPAKTTALQAAKPSAVVVKIADLDPFKDLENAFPVKFNTFPQIQVDQGNFKLRDGAKNMGDTISVEIISWQKQWQLAPGEVESAKAKEFLRYSPDGITAENGDNMQEILKLAKEAGFPKAKISERVIIVASVIDGGKQSKATNGKFHQFDLSQSSVANFGRYRLEIAFKISKGLLPEGFEPNKVKMHTKAKTQPGMSWTEAEFGDLNHEFED